MHGLFPLKVSSSFDIFLVPGVFVMEVYENFSKCGKSVVKDSAWCCSCLSEVNENSRNAFPIFKYLLHPRKSNEKISPTLQTCMFVLAYRQLFTQASRSVKSIPVMESCALPVVVTKVFIALYTSFTRRDGEMFRFSNGTLDCKPLC